MKLLRFTTAGSVDDGKSTLIGRLLFDSKSIFEDQLSHVAASSKKRGLGQTDLALLTDGLKDEREQGITIDVAYRYFSTPKRKFIIADTPGHIEYTRNMVTGASTADLAIILIDARKGLVEQTFRHSYIASLLKIPKVVVCINKMDLVSYDQEVFEKIKEDFAQFSKKLEINDFTFIPISALHGDNVVNRSEEMDWYKGKSLLSELETVEIKSNENLNSFRFPVQTVIRPKTDEFHDYRGYAGKIASGLIEVGDEVKILPSGNRSKVKSIQLFDRNLDSAFSDMSVSITLEDDIDVSRGDIIVKGNDEPKSVKELNATFCWFNKVGPQMRKKYKVLHANNEAKSVISLINHKIDVNTLQSTEPNQIGMNDIFEAQLKTTSPLTIDQYAQNRTTGSLILVDEATNETVAAGMII